MNHLTWVGRLSWFYKIFFLLIIASSTSPIVLGAMSMGRDKVPHFVWNQVPMEHLLPSTPLCIAASGLGDFVTVVKDKQENQLTIYSLDHAHLNLGWQKTGAINHATLSGLAYGLGRFFIFGNDTTTNHAIVVSSADAGISWNQQEIGQSTSIYNDAAFSSTEGVATGKNGAIAKTSDGITWTQVVEPSGIAKKVFYLQQTPDALVGFIVTPTAAQKRIGFFVIDDFSKQEVLFSREGTSWEPTHGFTNSVASTKKELLIYQGKGFAYQYPGVTTSSEYAVTTATHDAPHFSAISVHQAPRIQLLHEINAPIGQGEGWVALGKDLRSKKSIIAYSANRIFFVIDASPSSFLNPIIEISTISQNTEEILSPHAIIAIAQDGTAYIASTQIDSSIVD